MQAEEKINFLNSRSKNKNPFEGLFCVGMFPLQKIGVLA
jgi:hypothetical protein